MSTTSDIVAKALEQARRELIATSRTKLLNTKRGRGKGQRIEIVDERSDEIFRIIVKEERDMTFLPAQLDNDTAGEPSSAGGPILSQPEAEELDHRGLLAKHTDLRLQTQLDSPGLQKRLLSISREARESVEEKGVNTLFIALGFLNWYEAPSSDISRSAPLVLIPLSLERPSAKSNFRVRYTGDELSTNLSLQFRMKQDLGLEIPELPDAEDLVPGEYFSRVAEAVRFQADPRWSVEQDGMVLSFFSFTKLLMYRDLDPENWAGSDPGLLAHPLLRPLLTREDFPHAPELVDENDPIDEIIPPELAVHVVDADPSQALIIEEARQGRSLVVQGPPGTGKSQTITNIIAAAVMQGKTVLFVAEKMAALSVVKGNLEDIGLGDICLEIHSYRADRKKILAELKKTLDLTEVHPDEVFEHLDALKTAQDTLNEHARLMHTPVSASELTPYQIIGEFSGLRQRNVPYVDFKLEDALKWTRGDRERREVILNGAILLIGAEVPPKDDPWRGVGLPFITPPERDRLKTEIDRGIGEAETSLETIEGLSNALQVPQPASIEEGKGLGSFAAQLAAAPEMDRRAFCSEAWGTDRARIEDTVDKGELLSKERQMLADLVTDSAWTVDLGDTRLALAKHGRSSLRMLRSPYRRARETLRAILTEKPPKKLEERIAILDSLTRAREALARIRKADELGRSAFGSQWQRDLSDWPALRRIVFWEAKIRESGAPDEFRAVLARVTSLPDLERLASETRVASEKLRETLTSLFDTVKLDLTEAFGAAAIGCLTPNTVLSRLRSWRKRSEGITEWIPYRKERDRLRNAGLSEIETRIHDGRLGLENALDAFRMAYFEALSRKMLEDSPALQQFDGKHFEAIRARFRELDQERIIAARAEVLTTHHRGIPRPGGDIGELGLLKTEIAKKRRRLKLRRLLHEAGRAIHATKPVFMMSPMSVAQFLKPGHLRFDLLVIDEASQVKPVDAFGAIARCQQMIVVGDEKQLPPTDFWDRDLDIEDEEATAALGVESILTLCAAHNLPARMLRWHYRSRHHSLPAVSNREFYDNRLKVIPSPRPASPSLGLHFRYVPEGVYGRGESQTNPVEAKLVAAAVMEHARSAPDQSLGVGTFSAKQRDAILDELEIMRRENPDAEAFFQKKIFSGRQRNEQFFVKNLEMIQGDEREVIFISVGYGKDSSGFFAMSFGPLSKAGGERRLNVLVTRARLRCEVFSGLKAEDIDLERATGFGPRVFRRYLHYAETGELDIGEVSGRDYGSEFERQVGCELEAAGHKIHSQVGTAGFFIDLAIVDPEKPGRYVLGIECDGATYHRARSARERDRLRQEVLEDKGWTIHRIWSTDWFHRPKDQLKKTIDAIEEAMITSAEPPRNRSESRAGGNPSDAGVKRVEERQVREVAKNPRYREVTETDLVVPQGNSLTRLWPRQMAVIVKKVVEVEGPVHQELLIERVRKLAGIKRTGKNVLESIDAGISRALEDRDVERHDGFIDIRNRDCRCVRDRSSVQTLGLRVPERLPINEIHLAIISVVSEHLGRVSQSELEKAVQRLFGLAVCTSALKNIVVRETTAMVAAGKIVRRDDGLLDPPEVT